MTGSFELLNPKVQKFIINELKWNKLTEVQEVTIPHVLAGKNIIALAPTAGGKTESVFFPILSSIDNEKLEGISTLYISPIKALLNNQEIRLKKLSKSIYRDAFKWHGDVTKSQKTKFYNQPCSILMITPESLEVMLLSKTLDKDHLFSQLRFVVVDEIHSFAAGDRGSHLISVLERLQTYSKYDIQRLGLSATVGNPNMIGTWLKGSSKRKGVVIDPDIKKSKKKLNIFFYKREDEFTTDIYRNFADKKTLFFVNGRRDAEKIHAQLKEKMPDVFIHHSSMDKRFRDLAEEAFRLKSEPSCIICTSTMELGIDIGDLDSVLQLESPSSVSSFLQRIGRSGRRPGTVPEMTFYVSEREKLLMTLAVRELSQKHWVESIEVSKKAYHIYFHQILAILIQDFGKYKDDLYELLSSIYCFKDISREKYYKLIYYLVDLKIIEINSREKITLGIEGEKKFEYRNFKNMYSVFESSDEYTIKYNNREIGTLQSWFVLSMGSNLKFYLSGQSWEVLDIDEEHKIIYVCETANASLPKWSSQSVFLTYELCQEYLKIISGEIEINDLASTEMKILRQIQAENELKQFSKSLLVEKTTKHINIYTFAGNKVNYTLALMLKNLLGFETFEITGFQIILPVHLEIDKILKYLEKFRANNNYFFSQAFINKYAKVFPKINFSKFQKYLPQELVSEYLADLLLDTEKTKFVCNNFKIIVKEPSENILALELIGVKDF